MKLSIITIASLLALSSSYGASITIGGATTALTTNVASTISVEAETFDSSVGLFDVNSPPFISGGGTFVDAFQGNANGQGAYSVTFDNIVLGSAGFTYDLALTSYTRGSRIANISAEITDGTTTTSFPNTVLGTTGGFGTPFSADALGGVSGLAPGTYSVTFTTDEVLHFDRFEVEVTKVPEPTSAALLGLGGLALLGRRKR